MTFKSISIKKIVPVKIFIIKIVGGSKYKFLGKFVLSGMFRRSWVELKIIIRVLSTWVLGQCYQ